jgi:dephospho-CoA kinase
MLIVGLTGGVASGKSTVSKVFKEEGAYLIDADRIARELVQPHTSAWHELLRVFGEEILQPDGSVHRKRLAALVFAHPEKRAVLNRLLHPRIKEETQRRLEEIGRRDPGAIVVIDAALLVETGSYREVDWLIVVQSSKARQIERLERRDGMSREEAERIVAAQLPLEAKLKVADIVFSNDGTIEETRRRAKELFQELRRLAGEKGKGR